MDTPSNAILLLAKRYSRLISEYLPKDRSSLILDVGCGKGRNIQALKALGYLNIVGCDISANCYRLCLEKGLSVVNDNAHGFLSRYHEQTRLILMIDVIEHIPREIMESLFQKLSSALEPGGFIIIRAPNPESPFFGCDFYNDPTHQWCYTRDALIQLLSSTGLMLSTTLDEHLAFIRRGRPVLLPLNIVGRFIVSLFLFMATNRWHSLYSASAWYILKKV